MRQPIAIIGLAFRFPGDLNDEGAFWDALISCKDLIGSVPSDRWSVESCSIISALNRGVALRFQQAFFLALTNLTQRFWDFPSRGQNA